MGSKKKHYDLKFFELCEDIGKFDLESKTLYLKDNIKKDDKNLVYLTNNYTFFITESMFNDKGTK